MTQAQSEQITTTKGINKLVQDVLERADIQINGSRPWDMQIHDERTLKRVAMQRSLGLGESYMDGWWDCDQIDEMFRRLTLLNLDAISTNPFAKLIRTLAVTLYNRQNLTRARQVAEEHYDLGNDLYERMLDSSMSYSCGYWKDAETLEQAQFNKLDLLCRKLELKPGMTLLDIGCGWGGMARHAAEHYGTKVTGVTISKEQAALARERCNGLPVEIVLEDYRNVRGTFDRIVSIGMFEHVGRKNYRLFMEKTRSLLASDGLMALHTIGNNYDSNAHDPWIDKYIFPNGELPSISQISRAAANIFVTEDVHNFGPDYATTLLAWDKNFQQHWPELKDNYGERFYRMWRYYLNACAGAFQARDIQLWQWVFSPQGTRSKRYTGAR